MTSLYPVSFYATQLFILPPFYSNVIIIHALTHVIFIQMLHMQTLESLLHKLLHNPQMAIDWLT